MMEKVQKNLVDRVKVLADSVKQDLKKKGVVVPIKLKDGSTAFENYLVQKRNDAWYVLDKRKEIVAGPINLPQTAIVYANSLALGRQGDSILLEHDRWYGFKDFDEEVYTNSANNSLKSKNYDKADWCFTRASIAKMQKETHKKYILSNFNRLKTT